MNISLTISNIFHRGISPTDKDRLVLILVLVLVREWSQLQAAPTSSGSSSQKLQITNCVSVLALPCCLIFMRYGSFSASSRLIFNNIYPDGCNRQLQPKSQWQNAFKHWTLDFKRRFRNFIDQSSYMII